MKASELRKQTVSQMEVMLLEACQERCHLKIQQATHRLVATHKFRENRKKIARLYTLLREVEGKQV